MKLWLTVEYKNNDAVLKIVFDLKTFPAVALHQVQCLCRAWMYSMCVSGVHLVSH